MTTYRLPAALGGGEYEEYRHADGGTEAPTGTVAFLEAGAVFTVARSLLTKVEPLPPPEPPPGSVAQCNDSYIHIRQGASWTDHDDIYSTWARLCAMHSKPLTLLVPDPFAEPVELPWAKGSLRVERGRTPGWVRVTAPDVPVETTPARAREFARALWAAADAAEAAR